MGNEQERDVTIKFKWLVVNVYKKLCQKLYSNMTKPLEKPT